MSRVARVHWRHAAGLVLLAGVTAATVALAWVPERAAVGFDSTGLTSLRYGATEFLAAGDLHVNGVTFRTAGGTESGGDLTATLTVDQTARQVTKTFSWGSVAASYRAHENQIDGKVVVTNRSALTLQGISLEPLSIRLPSTPQEYDGVTPMMAYDPGQPAVLSLHYATGALVTAHEDTGALLIGYPWSSNRPGNTIFPLRVHTQPDPSYSKLYPRVTRPIAPGASDQFAFSLRFGPAGATAAALAADVYAAFGHAFPPQLNWKDRRPIGQLVLATTAMGSATNPRGWLLDPKIDVGTPAGLAAFRTAIFTWADHSVAILKELNAQGMIVWDIEGEQFPQPTTYLCDPRVLAQAAPEMEAIADAFFQKFRDAGLRVGVCVRPQNLVMTGTKSASQQTIGDPTQLLIDKIAYAKKRWGASLFYIDSNGDPNLPIDAGVFRKVLQAHPDVLLVPEHENTRYYAYTAPYREMRQRQIGSPASARLLYPNSFSVINVADGDFNSQGATVERAVQQRDVLLTRGWYPDPANVQVKTIYQRTTQGAGR